MGNIFVSSDLHFCLNKPFLYEPRGFFNIEEMNKNIVENWNSFVQPEDEAYVLGDIMLNDNEQGLELLKSLNGKIHIILGNHDTPTRESLYRECTNVVEITLAARLKYKGYHFFMTHYPCQTSNFDDNKSLKQRIINLCGHSHTKDPFLDWKQHPIFHCEVDTNDCYPWLLDDIIKLIKAHDIIFNE